MGPPKVFISSTLEPRLLKLREQVRDEVRRIGYTAVLSEAPDFAYSLGRAKVFDDTIAAVAASQLFVLVIGRRYGSVHPEAGLSITELEYEAAREDGLPSIVFVDDQVKQGWDRWRTGAMPEKEVSNWVDDVRVWDFLDKVMGDDACPVFPFADASAILDNLHGQLANFFGALLRFDHGARHWLWTAERTGRIERDASSVWVLSPDLYWDFQDQVYSDFVFANVVERRVPYRYLYSATTQNDDRVAELRASYSEALGPADANALVRFAAIPEDSFFWCAEHVLFNANTTSEYGLIVDVCEDRDRSKKYDVLMGSSKRQVFRRHFATLWAEYSTLPLVGA